MLQVVRKMSVISKRRQEKINQTGGNETSKVDGVWSYSEKSHEEACRTTEMTKGNTKRNIFSQLVARNSIFLFILPEYIYQSLYLSIF